MVSFVLERSVGDILVAGFRASVMTIDAEVLDNFKEMMQACGKPGAPLTKFLDEVIMAAEGLQDRLNTWCQASCNEVAGAVDRFDKKQANQKQQQQKKAKADEGSREKKAEGAKARAALIMESKAMPTLLFDATNAIIKPVNTYDDEVAYKKALSENAVKATDLILSSSRSVMFKTEKRGYGPCHADEAADMRAALAAFTPGLVEVPQSMDNALLGKTFKQLRTQYPRADALGPG
ncbi:unnamed protein product, partial [Prorocentrum cordatum]